MTPLKKKNESSRDIDVLAEKTSSFVKGTYKYISKKQVSTLKGFIFIAFIAGIVWTVFFIASSDKFIDTKASTGSAVLSWNANTEADLAGYSIYYGTTPRTTACPKDGGYASSIKQLGKINTYTVNNLAEGGTYYFAITSYDTAGNESCYSGEVSKSIAVTPVADTIKPTSSITSPANGVTVSNTVEVTANASDNIGVSKVEFYIDGLLKSTDAAAPYNWSLDTKAFADGVHTLTAKAYDAAANNFTSNSVAVTVFNVVTTSADTIAPIVKIATPTNGAVISASVKNIKLSTSATDNVGVTSIRAMVDGVQACSATTNTLACSLNKRKYTKGAHNITVESLDAAGNKGTASVAITLQ